MNARIIALTFIMATAVLLSVGCGPNTNSAPGYACFSIPTEAKVGQEVVADLSCAGKCQYSRDVNWGDGYWGEYLNHTYTSPGSYTVKFTCSTKSQHAKLHARKKRRHTGSSLYESTKTINIIP